MLTICLIFRRIVMLDVPSFSQMDIVMLCAIWYHLYNFRKREKHPWRSVTFRKVESYDFNKSNTPP